MTPNARVPPSRERSHATGVAAIGVEEQSAAPMRASRLGGGCQGQHDADEQVGAIGIPRSGRLAERGDSRKDFLACENSPYEHGHPQSARGVANRSRLR